MNDIDKSKDELLKELAFYKKEYEKSQILQGVSWQKLLEKAPEYITILNKEGKILYLNRTFPGFELDKMIGQNIYNFMQPSQTQNLKMILEQIFLTGDQIQYESQVQLSDGSTRYILNNLAAIESNDTISMILFMTTDITQRKKTEFKLNKTAYDLKERVKELNCLYNISKLIETPNLTLDNIMIGAAKLLPSSWQYPEITYARIKIDDKEYVTENYQYTKWTQVTPIIVHGHEAGVIEVGLLKDRTDERGYHFLPEEYTLINEIAERLGKAIERNITIDELNIAKTRAITANQMKSDFLAHVSHDIRTPLNGILGFTNILQKRTEDEESKKFLNKIVESGKALSALINDILDLSKIESGKLEVVYQFFNINNLIDRINGLFEMKFHEKNINFSIIVDNNMPEELFSDEWRIQQILTNLIQNAYKFTESGSVILAIHFDKENDKVQFSVSDTGIGIEEEFLDYIFDPFTQSKNNYTNNTEGSGLGLTICNNLVKQLGGKLTASSKLNQGTTLSFNININFEDHIAKQSHNEHHTDISDIDNDDRVYNILVADDNLINREILKEEFKTANYNTNLIFAENGKEAVKKALDFKPDLTLMDVQMPEMDGNQAIKALRDSGYTLPIITLSAFAMKDEIKASLEIGANGYITKPINFETFFETIKAFL